MKAQFSIKQVNVLKGVVKAVAKSESTNVLKFVAIRECCPYEVWFSGQPKPVFSL